eukprot:m.26857 g.26857  ORF g.26857 m.26857 type:complete len:512 (-) comp13381_c0_seq5:2780-4315(-)
MSASGSPEEGRIERASSADATLEHDPEDAASHEEDGPVAPAPRDTMTATQKTNMESFEQYLSLVNRMNELADYVVEHGCASARPTHVWSASRDNPVAVDAPANFFVPTELEGDDDAILAAVHNLFRPGAFFAGQIVVPGIDDNTGEDADEDLGGPSKYTLTILYSVEDSVGGKRLCARHEAYGDVQSCDIAISIVKTECGRSEIRINYQDEETICKGRLDLQNKTLSGNVSQLQLGEEGFEVASDEVTHTFTLKFQEEADTVISFRSSVFHLGAICTKTLTEWQPDFSCVDRCSKEALDKVHWGKTFLVAVRESEATLALLRCKTRVLQDTRFDTLEDRAEQLRRLVDAGYARLPVHKEVDIALRSMWLICALAEKTGKKSHLVDVYRKNPDSEDNDAVTFTAHMDIQKQQMRARLGYSKFDAALKALHRRLPKEVLQRWVLPSTTTDTETTCAICICDIDTADEVGAQLPCKHIFHMECIASWIHGNACCPNCRFDLSKDTLPPVETVAS